MAKKLIGHVDSSPPSISESTLRLNELLDQANNVAERIEELQEELYELRVTLPAQLVEVFHELPVGAIQESASALYWRHEKFAGVVKNAFKEVFGRGFNPNPCLLETQCENCFHFFEVEYHSWNERKGCNYSRRIPSVCKECQRQKDELDKHEMKECRKRWKREAREEKERIAALRNMPYQEYLRTEHWQGLRKRALRNAYYKCQLCYAEGVRLDVHHKTYERRGCEWLSDLIVLCEDCHGRHHGILPKGGDQ